MKVQPQKTPISSIARFSFLILLTGVMSLASSSFGVEVKRVVKVRDGKKLSEELRTLTELNNEDELDGKYFKIVNGESDQAVKFSDDDNLVFRASTAYYHLMVAHDYFAHQPEFQEPLFQEPISKKIVIRVEVQHRFSSAQHFMKNFKPSGPNLNDFSTYFSTSLSIPASNPHLKSDVDLNGNAIANWGPEIWFMKSRLTELPSVSKQIAGMINSRSFKSQVRSALLYQDMLGFESDVLMTGGHPEWVVDGAGVLLSLSLAEAIPDLVSVITSFFHLKQKMDSAIIPELAYHEYSHMLLQKVFGLEFSSALDEGYPDFFALKISGLSKIVARLGNTARNMSPHNSKDRQMYSWDMDYRAWAAHSSYPLGMLSQLESELGSEYGYAILVKALHYLNVNSLIKPQLEEAIARAIQDLDASAPKEELRWKARKAFDSRG